MVKVVRFYGADGTNILVNRTKWYYIIVPDIDRRECVITRLPGGAHHLR